MLQILLLANLKPTALIARVPEHFQNLCVRSNMTSTNTAPVSAQPNSRRAGPRPHLCDDPHSPLPFCNKAMVHPNGLCSNPILGQERRSSLHLHRRHRRIFQTSTACRCLPPRSSQDSKVCKTRKPDVSQLEKHIRPRQFFCAWKSNFRGQRTELVGPWLT